MSLLSVQTTSSTFEQERLYKRYEHLLQVNNSLSRKTVSYQANKSVPGLRWMKYKEGFSINLVSAILDEATKSGGCKERILDPFAGMGTVPLVSCGKGYSATGIEIMPVGIVATKGIVAASNGVRRSDFKRTANKLLEHISSDKGALTFNHLRITKGAFSQYTESQIVSATNFLSELRESPCKHILQLACMSVLEEVSYTRKDGQYLRWDGRADRTLRSSINKGKIPSFYNALGLRLLEIYTDFPHVKKLFGGKHPKVIENSCLRHLQLMNKNSYDLVIMSPPYANRYDYTRTYALELAFLGYSEDDVKTLRQDLLSATVENKSKAEELQQIYKNSSLFKNVMRAYREQEALQEILFTLEQHRKELSNQHVIRLIRNYFLEMSLVIAELGRIVSPGGTIYMVNDNVQYHGVEVPVDLILSNFAEQLGFTCENIWHLPKGKGNSSQQMGRFGRKEIRKCVYRWKNA